MRILLAMTCFFSCAMGALGQERQVPMWNLNVRAGWNGAIMSDSKLNALRYSGHTYLHGTVQGLYSVPRARILLTGQVGRITQHVEEVDQMYEYNYIKHRYARLTIAYLHQVMAVNKRLVLFGGMGNRFSYTNGDQYFNSLLFPQGRNGRKSYIFSPLSLSAMVLVDYEIGSSNFSSCIGYTLLAVARRPGDNYVKQIGIDYTSYLITSYFPDFTGLQYVLTYTYSRGRIGPSISYEILVDDMDGFKSLHQMITVGVAMKL